MPDAITRSIDAGILARLFELSDDENAIHNNIRTN